MAKIVLISAKTARPPISVIGDVVCILPDSEPMNGGMANFDVKVIEGSVEKIQAELIKLDPSTIDESKRAKYKYSIKDDTKTTVATIFKTNLVEKVVL